MNSIRLIAMALTRLGILLVLAALCGGAVGAQTAGKTAVPAGASSLRALQTRPERTNYAETSRYDDVIQFMKAVAAASPRVHLTTYGYTFEGRALPLAVIGAKDASPEAVKATGKTRIYVQGNIHAGEVEGKEACLEILRDIALGRHAGWFNSVVLLINPIFNADGNERISLTNRGSQNGPIGGMGQRPNAQNYDLNRDFMKLDAPETRAFTLMMSRYDPHIVVDLHTTDGSEHAYQITYAPPLHPATAASVVDVLRNGLLPAVTKAIKAKDDMDFYYYGNFPRSGRGGGMPGGRGGVPGGQGAGAAGQGAAAGVRGNVAGGRGEVTGGRGDVAGGRGGAPAERAFSTTEPTARFGVNMIGLRNRLGILSETFSYLPFQDRIKAARRFVEEICNYAQMHSAEIIKATDDADRQSIVGREVGLRGRAVKSAEQVEILVTELTTEKNPYTGQMMRRRLDVRKPEKMYQYISFEPSETTIAPRVYLVPALRFVQDRLEAHGVTFSKLDQALVIKGEQFRIESSTQAEREYEGHRARTLTGKWESAELNVPAGTLVVPVDQPLGRLVLMLFEPRSEDCLAYWGLMEDVLAQLPPLYPVLRTSEAVPAIR
jgi:hypothetical protein